MNINSLMVRVFVRSPEGTFLQCLSIASLQDCQQQVEAIYSQHGVRVTISGVDISEYDEQIPEAALLEVELPVIGGKGGFGSLLRIAAAQKKHFNNFDSTRDSKGRRLRDIKNELRLIEYIKKKKEEQRLLDEELAEVKRQRKERKELQQNIALAGVDRDYNERVYKGSASLRDTVREGLLNKRKKKLENSTIQDIEEDQEIGNVAQKKLKTQSGPKQVNKKKPSEDNVKASSRKSSISQKDHAKSLRKKSEDQDHNHSTHQRKPIVQEHLASNTESKAPTGVWLGPSLPAQPPVKIYPSIDLTKLSNLSALTSLDPEHIKAELKRLGLKCGGKPEERAQRLWDIKLNPALLFNSKYLAKGS